MFSGKCLEQNLLKITLQSMQLYAFDYIPCRYVSQAQKQNILIDVCSYDVLIVILSFI